MSSLLGACGLWRNAADSRRESGPGGSTEQTGERERQAAVRARLVRQQLTDRCLRERPELETRMANLRRAEAHLARVKEEVYVPLAPPPPWDEEAEARFRLEDQEADWLRHQREQDLWRQGEERRRALWEADQRERLAAAQERLNAEARGLRSRRADLFTGPGSIVFNPVVEARIRGCRPLVNQAMGETAPP